MSLRGKVVAITRPEAQAHELARTVSKLGGKPYIAPTLMIKQLKHEPQIKELINKATMGQVDFAIFLSRNSVKAVVEASEKMRLKAEFVKALNRMEIVAIGPKTKEELQRNCVEVSIVPSYYTSKGIVESLRQMNLRGRTVAIPRASKADMYLRKELSQMGADVMEIPMYEYAIPSDESKMLKLLHSLFNEEIDIITFTSSKTFENLFQLAKTHALDERLRDSLNRRVVVAVIGPSTQRTLEKHGVKADVVPKEYTVEAMVDALLRYLDKGHALKT